MIEIRLHWIDDITVSWSDAAPLLIFQGLVLFSAAFILYKA